MLAPYREVHAAPGQHWQPDLQCSIFRAVHCFETDSYWFFSVKNSTLAPSVHFMVQRPVLFEENISRPGCAFRVCWLTTLVHLQNGSNKEFPDDPGKQSWWGADNKRVAVLDQPGSVCMLYCILVHVFVSVKQPRVQKDDPAVYERQDEDLGRAISAC